MHSHPISVPTARLLTVLAVALCSVTAVSVGLAMFALIEDRLLAGLFAGAAVVLDVVKYLAWPLALALLTMGRRVSAVLMMICALILGGVSGWATYDRLMSSILTGRAQHTAIQEQRITDLEAARRLDIERLSSLDTEARSSLEQAADMRERGMVSKALLLETSALRRLDVQREQVRERLDSSSRELTALRAEPARAASLSERLATLLCLGFAAALEVVPALILAAVRRPATAETALGTVESEAETDATRTDETLLQALLASAYQLGQGERIGLREFARDARIGNTRATRIFGLAEELGALRKTKTPAGYVVA
jgi:hypothetical protein